VRKKIGLLTSGNILDDDILAAAKFAIKEHHTLNGKEDFRLKLVHTGVNNSGLLMGFDKLWNEGVRVFISRGSDDVKTLCGHVDNTGKQAVILAPTAFKPDYYCPQLISLYPGHGALLVAEFVRIRENGYTHVIPIAAEMEKELVAKLAATATSQGLIIEKYFQLDSHNTSMSELQETLLSFPRAAIWLSLNKKMLQVFPDILKVIQGHLITIHAHPTDISEALLHPEARRLAEMGAICTSEWAGSSPVYTAARRRFLAALQPKDPLIAALVYDAVSILLPTLVYHSTDDMHAFKNSLMNEAANIGITRPIDMLGANKTGFVVLKRLVMRHLIGKAVLQDSHWLTEAIVKVTEIGYSWSVVEYTHSPVHLVTNEEIISLAERKNCSGNFIVRITAHDPLSHRSITTSWTPMDAPELLLLPNGSPKGFILQASCTDTHDYHLFELGCQGNKRHNESLVCVTLSGGSEIKRSVRNTVRSYRSYSSYSDYSSHGDGNYSSYSDYNSYGDSSGYSSYSSYTYPTKLKNYQKYPSHQPPVDGSFKYALKKLKKFLTNEEFKSIIPQIGGCIGATGGCTFCFVYLLLTNVAIQPGVCFGACSVAIGGSCTTLLAKGVQYHLDQSVICSELFKQGRLSLVSYLADGSYGSQLATTNPMALRGYQTLAAPLVAAMQVSPVVSSMVEYIAHPWMLHMEYVEGFRVEDNTIGNIMTQIGIPVCFLVSVFVDYMNTVTLLALVALLRRARTYIL
ncbi:hypothetical protein SK128_016788, partial [Halocaridina rubra]